MRKLKLWSDQSELQCPQMHVPLVFITSLQYYFLHEEFTHFSCTAQGFSVELLSCVTITLNQLQNIFIIPIRSLVSMTL